MRRSFQTLRWVRRTALAGLVGLFVVSQMGILLCGKGKWGEMSSFHGIISLSGEIAYVRILEIDPPPGDLPWDRRFVRFSDRLTGGFIWPSLGFYYRHINSPGFQYRKSATDPTMITRPAFSSLTIAVPYWPLLVLLALPELGWLIKLARKRLMLSAIETASAPCNDDSQIAADLPCVHCAYNLRMQPRNARCPECGSPIVDTLNLNAELARSRPGWLKSLALGNALLLAVRVVLMVVYAELLTRSLDLVMPTAVIAGALYLFGSGLLTIPEHPFLESPDRSRAKFQRILALIVLILLAAGAYTRSNPPIGSGILGIFNSVGYGYFSSMSLELLLYAWLIFCVLVVMEYFFLARLAGRLLDRFMTEHCKIAGIGAAVGGVIVIAVVRSIATDRIPWELIPLFLTAAVVILWQLFVIWAGFMNLYCAVRFLQQSWIAEDRWRRQSTDASMSAASAPQHGVPTSDAGV